MRLATAPPNRRCGRAGLTLIELLVVMAIIGVLASLAIGAVFTLRESQIKSFSETTVQKLASALDGQWKAALDTVRDEINPTPSPPQAGATVAQIQLYNTWLWAVRLANGEPRRAKVIYTKARLMQEFPINFNMAQAPFSGVLAGKPAYVKALGTLTETTSPDDSSHPWHASALLYLTLTQGRRGMAAFNPDDLDPSAIQTRTAGGQQFKIFVDAWGNPVSFFIFPVKNTYELAGGSDPQDPENTLADGMWRSSANGQNATTFNNSIHPFPLPAGTVVQMISVVASSGRDGQWGVDQYMGILNADQANDNIYSYRLRKFGARGD
jgi:prepilin-type N-terminal cleavage/methylation domain-containing protein